MVRHVDATSASERARARARSTATVRTTPLQRAGHIGQPADDFRLMRRHEFLLMRRRAFALHFGAEPHAEGRDILPISPFFFFMAYQPSPRQQNEASTPARPRCRL